MSETTLSRVQFGNPWAGAGQAQFAASLIAELPSGPAWNGPEMRGLMQGLAAGLASLHADAATLTETEIDPAQTQILLPNWLQDYGLPDCCTPLAPTLQQQRYSLQAKIAEIGGQSEAYFIAVAAALGWTITITRGSVGSYEWTVNSMASALPIYFRAGASVAGDPLVRVISNAQLECVLNQIKPAHSVLNFTYS